MVELESKDAEASGHALAALFGVNVEKETGSCLSSAQSDQIRRFEL